VAAGPAPIEPAARAATLRISGLLLISKIVRLSDYLRV
jgi:hypothetical protein